MISRLFLVFILFSSVSNAQSEQDSLWAVWNNESAADTARLHALNNFCLDLIDSDPDSAMYLAQLQYGFAEIRGLKEYRAAALNVMGKTNHSTGDLGNAILHFQQSHDLYKEIGDEAAMAKALNSIGGVYWTSGDYMISIDYRNQSIKIAREIGDR